LRVGRVKSAQKRKRKAIWKARALNNPAPRGGVERECAIFRQPARLLHFGKDNVEKFFWIKNFLSDQLKFVQ